MANSSRFVLPIDDGPGGGELGRRPSRRTAGVQPSRIRDEHVVGMPRVQRLSLSATGTPASGPGIVAGGDAAVDLGRRGPGLVGQHEVERVQLGLAPSIAARCSSTDVGRGPLAGANGASDVDGRSRLLPEDRRHAEPVVLDRRCRRAAPRRDRRSASIVVGAQHVHQGIRVRGRRDVVDVECLDVGRVVEHRGELVGEQVELVVGEGRGGPGAPHGRRRHG